MAHHETAQTPLQVKPCSLNIRGLNTPETRTQLLTLQKTKAHIVFIQETHFRSDNVPELQSNFFPTAYHASKEDSKSMGVSILISKHCPIQVLDIQRNDKGKYIFLKGSLHSLQHLTSFQTGILIVGGDFNVALSPSQDTSAGSYSMTYRALRAIKIQLSDLTLHDTWHTLHPNFTFTKGLHILLATTQQIFQDRLLLYITERLDTPHQGIHRPHAPLRPQLHLHDLDNLAPR